MTELITARQAESYIPPLEMFAGNYEIKARLLDRQHRSLEEDPNILIEGDPGTGKTAILIAYLREKFKNPLFYREDLDEARKADKKAGRDVKPVEEVREWQTFVPGKIICFRQIDGGTDSEADLRLKTRDLLCNSSDHSVALADEIGELFFRGFDEALRPVLTEKHITTYATAQNFHSKRKADCAKAEDQRLSALFRRFTHRLVTQNPTDTDHLRFLAFLIKEWVMKLDHVATLQLLVEKSRSVVGYSKRILVKAIDEPDRRLTRKLVEESDVDPLW